MIAYSVTHLTGADRIRVRQSEKGTTVLTLGPNAETTVYLEPGALENLRSVLESAGTPS